MTKATITHRTKSDVTLSIIVSKTELQSAKQAVLNDAKKDIKIAGFRPGQAPDSMVERQLDPSKLQLDVVEKMLAASFSEAVTGHNLRTLAQPKVEVKKFVPFDELEYEAKVAILPEITFDYSKLKLKYDEPKLDEAVIDIALQNLREQFAERKTVNRAAITGDEVRLDFDGSLNGKPVEGAKGMNQMLVIGSGRFIPGFEDEVIGLKKGAKKTFEIVFPKDYHSAELAGQKVTFKVEIHEVREIELPKVDNAFAKKVANMPTLGALKDDIRKNLLEGKQTEVKRDYEAKVLAEAIRLTKVEISPVLQEEQIQDLRQELEQQIKGQGLELKDWLKIQKKSESDFEKELKTEADRRIGIGLVIRDVITKRKISATDDEITSQIEIMRTTYSDPEVLKHLDHDHFKTDVGNRIVTQKAVDWLCDQAKAKS